jgi:uracil-DNA glycosylase
VFSASKLSRILIVGQAPGLAVHTSGIPWDDKSGSNFEGLVSRGPCAIFIILIFLVLYPWLFAIPGRGKSGDLPPSKECAPQWHNKFLAEMNTAGIDFIDRKVCPRLLLAHR